MAEPRYRPIRDYAAIGDCDGAALVSRDGSIDRCTLRRFDADPVACRTLDAVRGGFWLVRPLGGRAEDEAEAERLYRELAPLITFLMQSVDQFLCYGKRLTARRIGLAEVHDRAPAQAPTPFGLECLARHAAVLERLP